MFKNFLFTLPCVGLVSSYLSLTLLVSLYLHLHPGPDLGPDLDTDLGLSLGDLLFNSLPFCFCSLNVFCLSLHVVLISLVCISQSLSVAGSTPTISDDCIHSRPRASSLNA